MSEITLDLRHLPRQQAYSELKTHIDNVLTDVTDEIAAMATISSLVHHAFGFLWTGFYRVEQDSPLGAAGDDAPVVGKSLFTGNNASTINGSHVASNNALALNKTLIVGPYQGTLGCLSIAFGKGVCGTTAAEQRVLIVDDVEKFPGHISCDGRSRSEIVLPVWNSNGELIAVFDVDSDELATFGQEDADGLSNILDWFRK